MYVHRAIFLLLPEMLRDVFTLPLQPVVFSEMAFIFVVPIVSPAVLFGSTPLRQLIAFGFLHVVYTD